LLISADFVEYILRFLFAEQNFAKQNKTKQEEEEEEEEEEEDFQPPLDIVDEAARVMEPLFDGINTGKHWCGKFLKDYNPIPW